VDADKERNLGIILLEPNGSLIPASVESQVIHMSSCMMPLTGTYKQKQKKKKQKKKKGETNHYPSILST
jgi:hypothetical protein